MYFNNIIQKVKLPFRKDKELYRCLYQILGFYPKDISYYKQALMHKSMSGRGKQGRCQNNERLEFLGDAILDAVVGDIVYRHFEGQREGFLTNTRSKLVQRETLGKLAIEMGLDKLIQSSGQRQQTPHSYMAGNAFEALVGAIYLDYGYQKCMQFMEKRILSRIIDIDKVAYREVNFKSKLLEWSQKNRIKMSFQVKEQRTDTGASLFITQIVVEGLECGRGKGYSKKESEQLAAKETLYMLKKQKGLEESVFEAKSRRTAMEEQPEALLPDIPDEMLEPQKPEPIQSQRPKRQDEPKVKKQEDSKPKQDEPKAKKQESKSKKQDGSKSKQDEPKAEMKIAKIKGRKPEAQEPESVEQTADKAEATSANVEQVPEKVDAETTQVEETKTEAKAEKPKRRTRKKKVQTAADGATATDEQSDAPAAEEQPTAPVNDEATKPEAAPAKPETDAAEQEVESTDLPVQTETSEFVSSSESVVLLETSASAETSESADSSATADSSEVEETTEATEADAPKRKPRRHRRRPNTRLSKEASPVADAAQTPSASQE